jgi:hypothetical protein
MWTIKRSYEAAEQTLNYLIKHDADADRIELQLTMMRELKQMLRNRPISQHTVVDKLKTADQLDARYEQAEQDARQHLLRQRQLA